MTNILTCILCLVSMVACGQEKMSTHILSYYKNDKEEKILKSEVSIKIGDEKITATRAYDKYTFPIIDTAKEFTINIKLNGRQFAAGPFKAWFLNSGSRMIFGELTKLNSLLSVAKYNQMSDKDKDWELFSKRFFIIDQAYTIDIDNYKKIKELQFFILTPNSEGDGIYSLTQKVVKVQE